MINKFKISDKIESLQSSSSSVVVCTLIWKCILRFVVVGKIFGISKFGTGLDRNCTKSEIVFSLASAVNI